MTDAEIKDRIRQQLLNGVELSSVLPTAPGQGSRLTLCVAPAHHCAACVFAYLFNRWFGNVLARW